MGLAASLQLANQARQGTGGGASTIVTLVVAFAACFCSITVSYNAYADRSSKLLKSAANVQIALMAFLVRVVQSHIEGDAC